MTDIIYKARSNTEFFFSVMYRMAWIAAMVYLGFHYHENPSVIAWAIVICAIFFTVTGNDEITVYEDKVTQGDTSILSLLYPGRQKSYNIHDISSASIAVPAKATASEIGVAGFLAVILKRRHYRVSDDTTIWLDLNDGKRITLNSGIETCKLHEVVESINSLVKKQHIARQTRFL